VVIKELEDEEDNEEEFNNGEKVKLVENEAIENKKEANDEL
jgi:hypothetical protein